MSNYTDIKTLFAQTPVKDVMSKPAVTIEVSKPFSKVEEKFVQNKIRHLPVIGPENTLVGLISKRDLFRTIAPRKSVEGDASYIAENIVEKDGMFYSKSSLDNFILKNVMVKDVKTLKEDAPLSDALDLLVKHKIGCVPVLNAQGEVAGIITRFDILTMINEIV